MILVKDLLKNLSVARAEFKAQNESVYSSFVRPPFYEQVNILNYQHSIALVGGRGSGKTMYLRYFSHWSQLDPNASPTIEALENTILYWKPDTIFFRSLEKGWISEKDASKAFTSFVSLEVTKEIISFLLNARKHFPEVIDNVIFDTNFIQIVNQIYRLEADKLDQINLQLDLLISDISSKVFNEEKFPYFRSEKIIQLLISTLAKNNFFKNFSVKVYIDEFENLTLNQQSYINGLRKHSDSLLSWNVAYKAFASVSNYVYINSPDSEQLQKQNDYREINIGNIIKDCGTRDEFFAKILLVSMNKEEFFDTPFNECYSLVNRILQKNDLKSLIANYVNENANFIPRLAKQLDDIRNNLGEDLFKKVLDNPYLAIALTVIKQHNNFDIEILKSYLNDELSVVVRKRFDEKQNHYIQAAIYRLNLISSYNNIPIYSGFDKFMSLCAGNVRHFLELCYQSFQLHFSEQSEIQDIEISTFPTLSTAIMHKGATLTSQSVIKEVISFAPMGLSLNNLVSRMGELFRITHQLDVITQPENNHFGIKDGGPNEKINKLLMQALCWNVLLEYRVTKDRSQIDQTLKDYQLNPIYSPAFGISYRKMHKLEFTNNNLETICFGEAVVWDRYRKSFEEQNSKSGDIQGGLL